MDMNLIITYIASFFVCLYAGEIFYMGSDKGIFKMIGMVPIINAIVAVIMIGYVMYTLIDIYVLDKHRRENEKRWSYSKYFDLTPN